MMAEEQNYKFEQKHKDLYEKAKKAVNLEDHVKRVIKHRDAWAPALATMKGKKVTHMDDGIEMLTDAVIKYRKEAGIPVSESKEHRHYIVSEIEHLLKNENFVKSLGGDPEKLLKEGQGHLILTSILQQEQFKDLTGKINYEMKKIIPQDADFDLYHGMAHYHASLHPTEHYSKTDLAQLATKENMLAVLGDTYNKELDKKLKTMKYKPKN